MAFVSEEGFNGTASTKSETEIDAEEAKSAILDELASETAAIPAAGDPGEEKEDDDASEMLQLYQSTQETQTWHWEQQWVEIERSFVAPPLRLKKWVRVPDEENKTTKNRQLTVETGRDGTKILVGGFREYICPHPGCGKVFPAVGSLRKHMHIHGEKHFICPVEHCRKRFLDNSKLKRHMTIHFRDVP